MFVYVPLTANVIVFPAPCLPLPLEAHGGRGKRIYYVGHKIYFPLHKKSKSVPLNLVCSEPIFQIYHFKHNAPPHPKRNSKRLHKSNNLEISTLVGKQEQNAPLNSCSNLHLHRRRLWTLVNYCKNGSVNLPFKNGQKLPPPIKI